MLCALSIKPLEGSRLRLRRTRSMGIQSIWSWKALQRRGVARKAWLLMLVNALLPAFNPVMVRRGCSSLQAQTASAAPAASFSRATLPQSVKEGLPTTRELADSFAGVAFRFDTQKSR